MLKLLYLPSLSSRLRKPNSFDFFLHTWFFCLPLACRSEVTVFWPESFYWVCFCAPASDCSSSPSIHNSLTGIIRGMATFCGTCSLAFPNSHSHCCFSVTFWKCCLSPETQLQLKPHSTDYSRVLVPHVLLNTSRRKVITLWSSYKPNCWLLLNSLTSCNSGWSCGLLLSHIFLLCVGFLLPKSNSSGLVLISTFLVSCHLPKFWKHYGSGPVFPSNSAAPSAMSFTNWVFSAAEVLVKKP